MLSDGHGAFGAPTNIGVPRGPGAIAIGDFNGDGKLDLVTANPFAATNNVYLLAGKDDGTFELPVSLQLGGQAYDVAIADLNGDHIPDLVVSNADETVLLGNGDGTFRPAPSNVNLSAAFNGAVVDINGDGIPDLVAANSGAYNEYGYIYGYLAVFIGNGHAAR